MKRLNKIFILIFLVFNILTNYNFSYAKSNKKLKNISFNYENEELINIINKLAALKEVNILFPSDDSLSKVKISINLEKKLSIEDSWNLLLSYLNTAGFTIVPNNNFHEVIKNNNFIDQDLDLYINTGFNSLPKNNERIRYIYYFKHWNINDDNSIQVQKDLMGLLNTILPSDKSSSNPSDPMGRMDSGPAQASKDLIFDTNTNSIILSGQSNCIREAIKIVSELDRTGFRETVAIIDLKRDVERIISIVYELIKDSDSNTMPAYGYRPIKKKLNQYFSNVKAVAIERSNSIVLLGEENSVKKLQNLIITELDVPKEVTESIIKIKTLKYQDARTLAPILQNIITGKNSEYSQSTSISKNDSLKDVIIIAEGSEDIQNNGPTQHYQDIPPNNQTLLKTSTGGSNLVIAVRENDWSIVERIIDDLDQPEKQVAIEVLIADLSLKDDILLGSQSRNSNKSNSNKKASWQSAQIGAPVLNYDNNSTSGTIDMTKALGADLLKSYTKADGSAANDLLAKMIRSGSTILSFDNGNGVSHILQLLKNNEYAKIISQPFIVTQNHKEALVELSQNRLVAGSATDQSLSGAINIKQDQISASLKVKILPRISNTNNVNLAVAITANEFIAGQGNSIQEREIFTNANVSSGEVLVVGGLSRNKNAVTQTDFPLLSRVPIIGNLFKKRSQDRVKTTLMVFLSPKVITPVHNSINDFSSKKLGLAASETISEGKVFDGLKDPITHIMFTKNSQSDLKTINDFANQNK